MKNLILVALIFTLKVNAQEIGKSGATKRYIDITGPILQQEAEGNDLVCSYLKADSANPNDYDSENEVLKDCTIYNSQGKQDRPVNKVCLVEKIQCYNIALGHFEMNNLKFYIDPSEKCSNYNPSEAFKQHINIDSKVTFIGDH